MRFQRFLGPLLFVSIPCSFAAMILLPVVQHSRYTAYRSTCQFQLKAVAMAYLEYCQDAGMTGPPISSQGKGWAELLQPYAKSWAVFQCPAGRTPSHSQQTDYFYNAQLAGIRKIPFPAQTILEGDGSDNSGTNSHLSEIPFDWLDDENPARRHRYFINLAFADGHVKAFRPQQITNQWSAGDLSNPMARFAVKPLPHQH